MIVEYINHMGDDLSVVNDARVSFDSESDYLTAKDESLIKFLARGCSNSEWQQMVNDVVSGDLNEDEANALLLKVARMPQHWTPFAQQQIKLHIECPIFVARQDFKHQIGFTRNEVSRRYVDNEPNFFAPSEWRKRPEKQIKQGSGLTHDCTYSIGADYLEHIENSLGFYSNLIDDEVAPEQARMVLPQSMITAYNVTGSLAAWARAYNQRTDSHAQKEIADLYYKIGNIIEPLFPISWKALTK